MVGRWRRGEGPKLTIWNSTLQILANVTGAALAGPITYDGTERLSGGNPGTPRLWGNLVYGRYLEESELLEVVGDPFAMFVEETPLKYIIGIPLAGGPTTHNKSVSELWDGDEVLIKQPEHMMVGDAWSGADLQLRGPGHLNVEGLSLLDALQQGSGKILADLMPLLGESLVKSPGKVLADTLANQIESLRQVLWNRAHTELLTLVDQPYKQPGKTLDELLTLDRTVSVGVGYNRLFSDALTLLDASTKSPGKVLAEIFTTADLTIRQAFWNRSLSELWTQSDQSYKGPSKFSVETLSGLDSPVKGPGKISVETWSGQDSPTQGPGKVLSEDTQAVDQLLRSFTHLLSDAMQLSEALVKQPGKVVSDSVTLLEQLQSARAASLALEELLSQLDTTLRQEFWNRHLSETFTGSDGATLAGAGQLAKSLAELLTLTDQVARQVFWNRLLVETLALGLDQEKQVGKQTADTASQVDAPIKGSGSVRSENLMVEDQMLRQVFWNRHLIELFVLLHDVAITKQGAGFFDIAISESLLFSESLRKQSNFVLTDELMLEDVLAKGPAKVLFEMLQTLDELVIQRPSLSWSLSETAQFFDGLAKQVGKIVSDDLALVSNIPSQGDRELSEILKISHQLLIHHILVRTVKDRIDLTAPDPRLDNRPYTWTPRALSTYGPKLFYSNFGVIGQQLQDRMGQLLDYKTAWTILYNLQKSAVADFPFYFEAVEVVSSDKEVMP
jgi:hypothetical protein